MQIHLIWFDSLASGSSTDQDMEEAKVQERSFSLDRVWAERLNHGSRLVLRSVLRKRYVLTVADSACTLIYAESPPPSLQSPLYPETCLIPFLPLLLLLSPSLGLTGQWFSTEAWMSNTSLRLFTVTRSAVRDSANPLDGRVGQHNCTWLKLVCLNFHFVFVSATTRSSSVIAHPNLRSILSPIITIVACRPTLPHTISLFSEETIGLPNKIYLRWYGLTTQKVLVRSPSTVVVAPA